MYMVSVFANVDLARSFSQHFGPFNSHEDASDWLLSHNFSRMGSVYRKQENVIAITLCDDDGKPFVTTPKPEELWGSIIPIRHPDRVNL